MSEVMADSPRIDQAEQMISLIRIMRENLNCSEGVRESARAAATGAGLDEEVLWAEWFNENIHDPVLYGNSRLDPEGSYLAWLAARVAEPFRLSSLAVNNLVGKLGPDDGMRMAMALWNQEVAWAHRLRRSADVRIAVLSHMFVTAARQNPAREVARIAEFFRDALATASYAEAIEHGLNQEEIREGYGSEAFGPLYLRYAEGTMSQRVEAMPISDIQALARHVAGLEDKELRKFAKERALKALRGSSIVTMTGVIAEALKRGLDSSDLLAEWDRFVAAVRSDAFQISPGTGLPYKEFMTWLRTEAEPGSGAPSEDCSGEMMAVLSGARGWLSSLPVEYLSLGASDVDKFRAWSEAVVGKTRRAPRDLVLDYGFFLVKLSFS